MNKTHGVISLSLFFISQVLALTTLFLESTILGFSYAVVIVLASLAVVWGYCAKCPVRLTDCGHLLVGPATQIFPERKQGPYTKGDYAVTISGLAVLILLPQSWLWRYPSFLAGFWGLLVVAGLEINRFVCSRCENRQCIACPKKGNA